MKLSWKERFVRLADHISTWSKDPSTRCGAVIVGEDNEILSTGFNGFPRGVDEKEIIIKEDGDHVYPLKRLNQRWKRPDKYEWCEHAERNAIYNAAGMGVKLRGSTMFFNYSVKKICNDCVRAIIQSGIVRVVGINRPWPGTKGKYSEESVTEEGRIMLDEAGVALEDIDADL